MKTLTWLVVLFLTAGVTTRAAAAEPKAEAVAGSKSGSTTAAVRMGSGDMTFDTVPGWGLGEDGKSQIGSTHGSVVVDKAGLIYTSSSMGIFAFSPDGVIVRRFVGPEYANIHDMEIRDEADG